MNPEYSQNLFDRLRSKETSELIDLMKAKAQANEEDDELAIIKAVLARRQVRFPDMSKIPSILAKPRDMRPLAIDSNASICQSEGDKIEIHFPKNGFLRCGQAHFKNQEELLSYIAEALVLTHQHGFMRLKVKRKGKYQRVDRTGNPVFTFGDPILDIITDEHGWLSVGNETYHLLRMELASSEGRKGGILGIDLSLADEAIRQQRVAEATSPTGKYTLIECNTERLITASTNPSTLEIMQGSARMRFRSWKTDYLIYRSIGTEIETWGHDFSSASIQSTYADPVIPSNPFVCGIVKFDSDSDTNDDYVDEYESAVNAPLPSTVRSYCEARWFGQLYNGTVSKGECEIFV